MIVTPGLQRFVEQLQMNLRVKDALAALKEHTYHEKEQWRPEKWLGDYRLPRACMNNLIMDYLITGYRDAAEKFRDEAELRFPDDYNPAKLDTRVLIRETILKGEIHDAVVLINDSYPVLLDQNRYLHFILMQQQLLELIRGGETVAALEFAQTHLAEKGENDTKCLDKLEATLALLAFEHPENSPFAHLLDLSHRQKVASEVNSALLEAEFRHSTPKLESILKVIVWSQEQLDKKRVAYPKMTDFAEGTLQAPKAKQS